MSKKTTVERKTFNPKEIPIEGSLGLLALGDIGFRAWRELKIERKKFTQDEKE